jgi:hypothetical protein
MVVIGLSGVMVQRTAVAPGEGMSTGLSAETSRRRSRRAGMVR